MVDTEDVRKSAEAACEAAARGDTAKVLTCLHARVIEHALVGLDEPLLPMSESARYLLEHLNDGPFHPEHALRALMSIPCCYETPWRAAIAMIQAFHSQRGNLGKQPGKVLWTCVTDVQTFLQLTVEAWWKQERQRTASTRQSSTLQNFATTDAVPRHLLEQLADAILKPLGDEEARTTMSRDNQHWTQPLELVTTIVSLCQDLEPCGNKTLSDYVLNRLFPSTICPDRLLPWLTLASDLRSHLRDNDWRRLYDILQECIAKNTDSIPPSDMPGLVRAIVSLLVKQDDEERFWELLILHLLYSASLDATTYSTVETVLKSSLASLPNPIVARCIQSVNSGCASVPNWICSNMNLLLLQAIQKSGSQLVSTLVSRALCGSGAEDGGDSERQCWEALKRLAFPSVQETPRTRRQKQSNLVSLKEIKNELGGVYYQGNGQFMKDGEQRNFSSKIVCQSIFLGKTRPSKRSHHVFASERAQMWAHAADMILHRPVDATERGPRTNLDVIFAILTVVTIYCEVPASRTTIVRTAIQSLSEKDNYMTSDDIAVFHCVIVAMIVCSLTRDSAFDDGGIRELHPLASIFGESLAKDIFCDLTTALSPLPTARSALLSVSQKYLQSSFGGNLWWGVGTASRGMNENRDRVDCALHGLCMLLTTMEKEQPWDEYAMYAWVILSEVIVQNKPALPMRERTSLFRRLSSFAKQQKFSLTTVEHLSRACLVRLLQFFKSNDMESVELILERVFISWRPRDALSEADENVSQREDVVSLMRLVLLLHQYEIEFCRDGTSKEDAFYRGRSDVLRLLTEGCRVGEHRQSNEALLGTKAADSLFESNECSCSSMICACIAAVLRLAVSSGVPIQTVERNDGSTALEKWRTDLISTEIEECKACGMKTEYEDLPLWLNVSSSNVAGTVIHHVTSCSTEQKHKLLSSLCDIVLDLIFHPVRRDDTDNEVEEKQTDQSNQMMKYAIALVGIKRGLSGTGDRGIYVNDTELPQLSFDSNTLVTSAAPFLKLCANFIDSSLCQGLQLLGTDDILLSALTYCQALKQLVRLNAIAEKALDTPTYIQVARQLWDLYCAVGNENSAQRLVRYLEGEGVSQLEGHPDEVRASRSFLTIKTDDDVDRIVRTVRLNIVTTMGDWLRSLLESGLERSESSDNASHVAFSQEGAGFWLQILRSLCLDLQAGLEGHSGGMLEALYSAYLSLIETACRLISLTFPREVDVPTLSQASVVASECATALKEILCAFPLKRSLQFKKTMMLVTSEFPSIHRQAALMIVLSGRELPPSYANDFAMEVFHQMMHITERQQNLSELKCKSWAEIAGPEHVNIAAHNRQDGSSDDDDDDSTSRVGTLPRDSTAGRSSNVPLMIVIPGPVTRQTTNAAESSVQKEKKVQLPSKDSWVWASCCSLVAMEQIWVQSYSILNGNEVVDQQQILSSMPAWKLYCKQQTKLLSNVLEAVSFAMKSFDELKSPNESESSSNESGATILATTFADSVKARLCSLLEKISAVVQLALRSVSNQVKRGDEIADAVRVESVACLAAWLEAKPDNNHLEFLSKRWFQAEKKQSQGDGSVHKRMSPAFRRLPKFLVRMQEVGTDMGKLYSVLEKIKQEGSPLQQKSLDRYESLLSNQGDAKRSESLLKSLIKTKLKTLAKTRASSDEFNSSLFVDMKDTDVIRKRSQKASSLERQMRRERRKTVKRSRNQIVDAWLHLDDEYERDDGIDDDAYVDLEDFIV